jgi:hypothetical protein
VQRRAGATPGAVPQWFNSTPRNLFNGGAHETNCKTGSHGQIVKDGAVIIEFNHVPLPVGQYYVISPIDVAFQVSTQ